MNAQGPSGITGTKPRSRLIGNDPGGRRAIDSPGAVTGIGWWLQLGPGPMYLGVHEWSTPDTDC
jgi:hypothetical protein